MRAFLFKHSANTVTFVGMVAAVWTSVLVWDYQNQGTVLLLAIVAALTDLTDGWLARKWQIESPVGISLDRWRDKLFVCPLFVFFIADIRLETSLGLGEGLVFSFIKSVLGMILLIETGLIVTWFVGVAKKWNVKSHRAGKIKQGFYVTTIFSWLVMRFLEKKFHWQVGMITFLYLSFLLLFSARYAFASLVGYLERFYLASQKN
ncbi:MAG: CDP-alcohol phosphatidyltransferase family protein [Parcubacteria group bacterium]|nr:CDP-alcohol phosphatidyltransferase family protein [Parcubacteria group bacterium]